MSDCRKCQTPLVIGETWTTGREKNKDVHCNSCVRARKKLYDLKNPENKKNCCKRYYQKNKEKLLLKSKKYQEENSEKYLLYLKEYRSKEDNKTKHREASRKWVKNNRGYCNANLAKYRADKIQQTPPWADLKAIRLFYKNCPKGYHVDHIEPLRGVGVRGLHILINLQYLTAEENMKKGNRVGNK